MEARPGKLQLFPKVAEGLLGPGFITASDESPSGLQGCSGSCLGLLLGGGESWGLEALLFWARLGSL